MKALTQVEQVRDGQLKQITRMISDIADSDLVQGALAGLDKDGAERLKGNPEFTQSLREFTVRRIGELSVTNQFSNEEVSSTYAYRSGYKPEGEDIDRQVELLQKLFPGLGDANPEYLQQVKSGVVKVPTHGEKFFAIPNIWKKGGIPAIFGSTYSGALQKVLDKIEETREGKFHNFRKGQIDEKHIRQSARTKKFMGELSEAQGNPDILIICAQFGIRHRGRSVRRGREVIAGTSGEFGLGAFTIGTMLLTHPNRLEHYDDLWLDCDDEFDDPASDVRFGRSPCFSFSGDKVGFDASYVGPADECYGVSSGFPPQIVPCTSNP